jgi:hypothetical protein
MRAATREGASNYVPGQQQTRLHQQAQPHQQQQPQLNLLPETSERFQGFTKGENLDWL